MKKFFITILFVVFVVSSFAQGTASDAEKFFNSKNFSSAAAIYEQLLVKKPTDPLNNYRLGRCYYEMGNLQRSVPYFEIAKEKFPASNFYIGLYAKENYNFAKAKTAFESYLAIATDPTFVARAKTLLRQSTLAADMITRVEDIALIDSVIVDKNDFLSAYNIAKDLGKLTMTVEKNGTQTFDKVIFTTERGDRRIFSQLNGNQSDIFSSYKLTDEQWTAPVSISQEINTLSNENYPFLMTDGITFYFAAEGEKSIGGYDIFMTRFNPAKNDFYTPENVGMPFNSPYNDYMMVVDDVRKVGWFASDRFQPKDKVVIYRFLFENEKKILRSEDSENLIKYAQLRLARKAEEVNLSNLNIATQENTQKIADFQFFINNQKTYYSISEFKNAEAANLFQQFENERINIEKLKEKLDLLRNTYANVSNEEKKALVPQILQLENDIPQREKKLPQMQQKIRELENNSLK